VEGEGEEEDGDVASDDEDAARSNTVRADLGGGLA